MKRKKFAILTLIFLLLLSLALIASCGEKARKGTGEDSGEAQVPPAQVKESAGEKLAKGDRETAGSPSGMQTDVAASAPQGLLGTLLPQSVVARANDAEIKAWVVRDIEKGHREQVSKQIGSIPAEMEKNLARAAIESAIKSELLYQQALKEGISVEDKDVEDYVNSVKMTFPNEENFKEFMKSSGCSESDFKQEAKKKLIIGKYEREKIAPQVRVSEKDAREYYDKNREHFKTKDLTRASFILIPYSEDTPPEKKAELRKKAEEALREAKSGKDFAGLAKKYSGAPNAQKGGDLGYFPRGVMVPNFEKIAFDLKIGEISDIFETQFGYNILKVTDRKEAGYMDFENIKMQIIDRLMQKGVLEAIAKKASELKSQAKIEIMVDIFQDS
ncbi:MAG: peptidylprolyl isomerase [Acidobacteriota bacterium]